MILVLDNYDSFTYNLVHSAYNGEEIKVIRNDEMLPETAAKLNPDYLIISPGPGKPDNAGYTEEFINYFKGKIPILGICLGHQAIYETFGGNITQADQIVHGKTDMVTITNDKIFENCSNPMKVGRYHSLIACNKEIPQCFDIIAYSENNEIMGIKHKKYPIWGLQFHPESILTDEGDLIIQNFLRRDK